MINAALGLFAVLLILSESFICLYAERRRRADQK